MSEHIHIVNPEEASLRLDVAVSRFFPEITRSQAQRLIELRLVKVNGEAERSSFRIKAGQEVAISIPAPVATEALPEDIPLLIIYEDSDLVVINKPAGLVVHPAAGNRRGTLVNALLFQVEGLSGIGGEERPGIVHRLDKDTSGLIVVAKNDYAHVHLVRQLAARTMGREYIALVHGRLRHDTGTIDLPIGRHPIHRKEMAVSANGRPAKTHYTVVEALRGYTLVKCKLETGRTHQIRVHMAHLGHPIVGDPVYGPSQAAFGIKGQLLHARKLTFVHPRSKEVLEFSSVLPPLFAETLVRLGAKSLD